MYADPHRASLQASSRPSRAKACPSWGSRQRSGTCMSSTTSCSRHRCPPGCDKVSVLSVYLSVGVVSDKRILSLQSSRRYSTGRAHTPRTSYRGRCGDRLTMYMLYGNKIPVNGGWRVSYGERVRFLALYILCAKSECACEPREGCLTPRSPPLPDVSRCLWSLKTNSCPRVAGRPRKSQTTTIAKWRNRVPIRLITVFWTRLFSVLIFTVRYSI